MEYHPLKRPLYVVGLTFGLCAYAATVMGYHTACIVALLCGVLFVVALAVRSLRQQEGVMAALLAAGVAFSLFVSWEYRTVQPLTRMDGETLSLTLWMEEEVSESENAVCYFARVREGALPNDTRVAIWVSNNADAPQLYERVTTTVLLQATDQWRADNVFLSAWAEDYTTHASDERPWDHALLTWRTYTLGRLETRADGEVAALLRAICFGDTSALSTEVKEGFSAAGLSHVTAVSGFHMSVVSFGLFKLLCFWRLPKRWAALLTLPVPALFAALTGFSYSALRAGVMCTLMLLGVTFRRAADARNSLGGAVLLLLILDPAAVYDLGFQLSVSATWGLLLVSALQSPAKTGFWRKMAAGLQLTVAAVIATLPLSAMAFGRISALSPLTNLIAQPLGAVIVGAGCVGTLLLCVPWLAFLGAPLILVAGVAARGLLALCRAAAALPFAFLSLRQTHLVVWALAVPFALLFGWWLLKGRGLRITAMLLVVALCLSTVVYRFGMRGVTSVTTLPLEEGTLVWLARDGHHAVIVAGEAAVDDVTAALERQGVKTVDFVLFTKENTAAYVAQTAVDALEPCAEEAWSKTLSTVTFWEDTSLAFYEGWCRLQVGEQAVLVAPCDGVIYSLPAEYREAHTAIFDRVPPRGVEILALSRCVLSCNEEGLPEAIRSTMWGVYPIDVTTDEAITIRLR